jgi:MOSC domain-containing protein YiiM
MESLDAVGVSSAEGLHADFRGGLASTKKGRRRQVSLVEAEGLGAALADAHAPFEWWNCRRNLLVAGLRLPRSAGTKVGIGASLVLEITGECEPCERMDALKPGLRAAMMPDWRGGFTARVLEDGEIAVGDAVTIL